MPAADLAPFGGQKTSQHARAGNGVLRYRRPRTTTAEPGHKIYPYLLRGMEITRPNQVWAMDITYIPMTRGFVYLAVVLDWFSRRVLSWRLSITMEAAFCVETLEDAMARHGKPEVFNTDQGSPAPRSPGCSSRPALRSAWTARTPGRTTCSWNASGARSTCGPMTACRMPATRLVGMSISTIPHHNTHLAMWLK
jgi:integrase-like protein